jgi:hypothetical protein
VSGRSERVMESSSRWLKAYRSTENTWRLRAGLRVMRTERAYRSGAVKRLAEETRISKSSLYEYADIWTLCYRWLGSAARNFFELYPALDFTHLRIVLRYFNDLETQIDALLMAVELDLSPEAFAIEIRKWRGDSVPPVPVFDERGEGEAVVRAFLKRIQSVPNWQQRQLRITVR